MNKILSFSIGDKLLGIDVMKVVEIIYPSEISRVPLGDSSVLGLINLRGRIISEIDLRIVLGSNHDRRDSGNRVVIVETSSGVCGFLVDGVGVVINIDNNNIEDKPNNVDGIWKEAILNILKIDDSIITILDVDKLANT